MEWLRPDEGRGSWSWACRTRVFYFRAAEQPSKKPSDSPLTRLVDYKALKQRNEFILMHQIKILNKKIIIDPSAIQFKEL